MPTKQTDNFEKHLLNMARGYASYAVKLAKGYAPNRHLRESIHSLPVEQRSVGDYIIRVRASGPDARSREYGSGVWARRGPKGKILIRPRNAPLLVFPWQVATSPISGDINIPRDSLGLVHLKQVEHPGVDAANEGQGYIGPAMREALKANRERMKKDGAAAIKLDMRAAFQVKGTRVNVG